MPLFFKQSEEQPKIEEKPEKHWLKLSIKGSNVETIWFLISYLEGNLRGFRKYYADEIPLRFGVYRNYIEAVKSVLENCNVHCFFTYQPLELNISVEDSLEDAIDYLRTALLIEQVKEVNRKINYEQISSAQGSQV